MKNSKECRLNTVQFVVSDLEYLSSTLAYKKCVNGLFASFRSEDCVSIRSLSDQETVYHTIHSFFVCALISNLQIWISFVNHGVNSPSPVWRWSIFFLTKSSWLMSLFDTTTTSSFFIDFGSTSDTSLDICRSFINADLPHSCLNHETLQQRPRPWLASPYSLDCIGKIFYILLQTVYTIKACI